MNRKNEKGVTLIELMVAISVLAILVTVGVPSFMNLVKDVRMRSSVNGMVTALRVARGEAIKRGTTVAFCASADLANCDASATRAYIVFSDADGDYSVDGTDELIHVYERRTSDPDIHYSASNQIQFRSTGRASDAPNFEFCDSRGADYARSVKVSRTGRVSGVGHLGTETCS